MLMFCSGQFLVPGQQQQQPHNWTSFFLQYTPSWPTHKEGFQIELYRGSPFNATYTQEDRGRKTRYYV